MVFTKQTLRRFSGKLIELHFLNIHSEPDWIVGRILSIADKGIVFEVLHPVNTGKMIIVEYKFIKGVNKPEKL